MLGNARILGVQRKGLARGVVLYVELFYLRQRTSQWVGHGTSAIAGIDLRHLHKSLRRRPIYSSVLE